MDEEWISSTRVRKELMETLLTSLVIARQLRVYAGCGLLRIKARSASFYSRSDQEDLGEWVIDQSLLRATAQEPSAARIDLFADTLEAHDPQRGLLKCVGLSFPADELRSIFEGHFVENKGVEGSSEPQPVKGTGGNKIDTEAWSNFGAALAYIANVEGLETFKSRDSVYNRVADYLARRNIEPLTEKNFRSMIGLARHWIEEGEIAEE